ncbi:serine/threonine-protein kinase [Mycolicibacterium palauense]|uniref:serine/threonine-protein kinase n=1 Tax=Mycolicibacterium palauense TaxID=2034511 RepID=UPI000BFF03F6|nr:serine/threonine-protein kinase [Mycolicibacterium palauense]
MTDRDLLVDRYEIRGLLGQGGMAEVRDGWDTRLDRPVAIKLLHPMLTTRPDLRQRFAHEARAAATLSHPNVVAVYDSGEHDGVPFLVMERLPGRTLADVVAAGPMPSWQVRAVLNDVLAALAAAHRAGLLHRDIKPANILVSATGDTMKVGDFGIAKSGDTALTVTGQVVGTMCYMSPERLSGAPASAADDLYAVGVVGYEAVLARRAFPQESPVALTRAIADDPPPPLRALRPDLDPLVATVIDRAMTRDPGQRFTDAAQMRAALNGDRSALAAAPVAGAAPRPNTRILAEPLPPATTHPAAAPGKRRFSGRTRVALTAAAVLAALTVSVLAMAMESSSGTPAPTPAGVTTTVSTAATTPPSPAAPAPPSAVTVAPPEWDEVQGGGNGADNGAGNGAGNGNGRGNGHSNGNGKGNSKKG